MDLVVEQEVCYEQMAIVQKYEAVINYCYPIAQNMARKHGVVRDRLTRFLASWQGHASWADSHNLLNHLESQYALN